MWTSQVESPPPSQGDALRWRAQPSITKQSPPVGFAWGPSPGAEETHLYKTYKNLQFCYVLLCFAMFCYVLLCFVIFCYVLLYFAIFCYVLLCVAMFCYVLVCFAIFCYVLLCFAMFCYILLCFATFCYILLCFAMFCYILLYFAVSRQDPDMIQTTETWQDRNGSTAYSMT